MNEPRAYFRLAVKQVRSMQLWLWYIRVHLHFAVLRYNRKECLLGKIYICSKARWTLLINGSDSSIIIRYIIRCAVVKNRMKAMYASILS